VWEFAKSLGLTASLNFFASHHGFTLCDTHFGTGKQKLRRDFNGKLIETPEDIASVFAQLNNTTITILDEIPDHTIPKHFFKFE
jgi:pullulanase/glycogen debranching enzyme